MKQGNRRTLWMILGSLGPALLTASCSSQPQASAARRAEVAARGAEVMPFDLARTKHGFESLPDGGLQTVTANDAADTLQIRLVREHLQQEAAKFSRGEFADPMAIHGHAMPGLAELRQGAASIRIVFAAIPAGATIRYATDDPALVAALHRWFEAQRMDHGVGQ
ncbi:MAG TPA: hypothetical protein VIP80_11300 [Gemmatimonadales bacterium]|jgi:transposase